jgi:Zn-dependent metalloprotease
MTALGIDVDQSDGIIGAGLFTAAVNGKGLRSLKDEVAYDDPVLGRDPQPKHMRDYVSTLSDNGGVHINSGIPNHAWWRIALELKNAKAGAIWFRALSTTWTHDTEFDGAAAGTWAVAGQLFGEGSLEQQAVKVGWAAVGLAVDAPAPTPSPVPDSPCAPELATLLGALAQDPQALTALRYLSRHAATRRFMALARNLG